MLSAFRFRLSALDSRLSTVSIVHQRQPSHWATRSAVRRPLGRKALEVSAQISEASFGSSSCVDVWQASSATAKSHRDGESLQQPAMPVGVLIWLRPINLGNGGRFLQRAWQLPNDDSRRSTTAACSNSSGSTKTSPNQPKPTANATHTHTHKCL